MNLNKSHIAYDRLDVAIEPKGVHSQSVWFGGGRIGAHLEGQGTIEEIIYYGSQPMTRSCFYKVTTHGPYQRIFCPYILVEDRAYQLEMENTRIFPAGYVSHLSLPEEDLEIEHSLIMLNDAVMYRVESLINRRKLPLRMRLSLHEYLRVIPQDRVWSEWSKDIVPEAFVAKITDSVSPAVRKEGQTQAIAGTLLINPDPERQARDSGLSTATTWLGIVGSTALETRVFHSQRRFFDTAVIDGNAASMAVLFGMEEQQFMSRSAELRSNGPRIGASQVAAWEQRLCEIPAIKLGMPTVESFFRQAALACEMLMPTDLPGAMRASVGSYWVWGWDTMVYCDSYLVNGRADFVRNALELYRNTAHPEHGIGHQFSEKMVVRLPQALPAQGLYINMLYQYVSFTGEQETLREFYPFARMIFQRTISQAMRENLFKGIALFPDFPQFAGQKGGNKDLSIFNNSIFYQSARAMEHLAAMFGDNETAFSARDAWQKMEKSFREFFWDHEKGFWVDSIDSETLEKRLSYPSHSILWINSFAKDLLEGREEDCANFMATQLACKGGIRMYPRWSFAFNGDGNQLGQYYPTGPDLFFLKIMGATGRQEMLRRWLGWVEAFWDQYTAPEGVTLEAENDGPHRPDCPGGKQPFTIKPWQMGLINAIAGIDFDIGGLTVCPGLESPVTLVRIPFRGHQIMFKTKGEGKYVRKIAVNGKPVIGSCKIPVDHCSDDELNINVTRSTERPAFPMILSADGVSMSRLKSKGETLSVHLSSPGSARIWIYSPFKPDLSWRGKPIETTYCEQTGLCQILLSPEASSLEGNLLIACGKKSSSLKRRNKTVKK